MLLPNMTSALGSLLHWSTGTAFPILQQMRQTPLGFEGEEKKHLKAMLATRAIEPSASERASPPVLVRRLDKSWRYCIDFRALNSVTERDAYPLPLIKECIDSLDGMHWFCMLDMNSGYWQIPIAEENKKKTAFLTRYGLFHFLRMSCGLSNAPVTFQHAACGGVHESLSQLLAGRSFHDTDWPCKPSMADAF